MHYRTHYPNVSVLVRAVEERRLVSFLYDGLTRVVEPHVVGELHNHVQLQAFQVGGHSSSGQLPDWRRFEIDRAANVQILEAHFAGRRAYPSGRHSHFDRIIAVVGRVGMP